ncbi:MAG: TlpA family protein disulfide reductase [Candidatus Acidiferrales bacterium]
MQTRSVLEIILDLVFGVLAVLFVLGRPAQMDPHGLDFRVMFAATAAAFFCAGFIRGKSGPASVWLKGLLISAAGLLGTALLILGEGAMRLAVWVGLAVMAVVLAIAGIITRRTKSWIVAALSLAAAALVILAVVPLLSRHSAFETTNHPAPSFSVSAFHGRTISASDLRGHVVVLTFWATWCGPCRAELPEVQRVYTRFKGNPDVVVLAVDTAVFGDGGPEETADGGKQFLARINLDLPGAFDSGQAARAFGVRALPELVLLDKEGHVRTTHIGFDVSEHLESALSARIQALLAR